MESKLSRQAIGGQEQEPATVSFEHLCGGFAFVSGKVVDDNDVAWLQLWDETLFNVRLEGVPIHGPADHLGGHDPIAGQTRDQALIAPPSKRCISLEALTAQTATIFTGHFGVGAGFVQKDQALWLFAHSLLAAGPVMSCLSHRGLAALVGYQAFFICVAVAAKKSINTTG